MKREIKFRAWDNVNKNMELNIHHLDSLNEYLSKDKYDVMQFTGLKDKNGIEIYEGDIITMSTGKPAAIIEYDYCGFVLKWIDKNYLQVRQKKKEPIFNNINLFKITGNIYQKL